jgi:imidazole glycerol-phosphate synthase subunit HisF
MNGIRIIPKLDIKNSNLVKGIQLEGLRVLGSPKYFMNKYFKDGADEIIYHDVIASLYKKNMLGKLVSETAKKNFIPLSVGGGITSLNQIENLLKNGADRVFFNSINFSDNNFLYKACKEFGSSTIILSIEVMNLENKFVCFYNYGRDISKYTLKDMINFSNDNGVGEILITSIEDDGAGNGFNLNIAENIESNCKIPYMLCGGFSKLEHFIKILDICLPSAFVLSSVLHYSNIDHNHKTQVDGNLDFLTNEVNFLDFQKLTIGQIKKKLRLQKK